MNNFLKSIILLLVSLTLISCKKKDESGPTNPILGGGTGSVTFTIGQKPGTQGGIIFTARPSTNITINQVTVSLPAQGYQDVLQGNDQTIYQANQTYDLDEYIGVAAGQQWTFKFEGKLGSPQGQAYSVTSNYAVQ